MSSPFAFPFISFVAFFLCLHVAWPLTVLWEQCPDFVLSLSSNLDCSVSGGSERASEIDVPSLVKKSESFDTISDFFPWTHPPICTDIVSSLNAPLCIFTNASFSSGRGISIITTEDIALEFASLEPFVLDHTPTNVNTSPSRQPWKATPIANKGMGLVATESIPAGSLIAAYQPVVLVHPEISSFKNTAEGLIRLAVDQLPPSTSANFLNLSTQYNNPHIICSDILKSNSFELAVGPTMHLSLIPEPSRLNHDCGPNAQYYLDHSQLTHYVHASREIAEGEEITVSYVDPFATHAGRQEHLSSFGFTCTCRRCTNDAASDRTLGQIHELQGLLGNWKTRDATPEKALELIKLSESEGLDAFMDVAYGHAALAYNAVRDKKRAKEYATLAREKSGQRYGPHGRDLGMWDELMNDPTKHWSWMWRKRNVH
ncbi:SET domain-containing protein [Rhizodiscina lignyota]|uniref:SET domain-containing protein n=1 Tax=Rhizodiscina lignyota TaxID=1504668 RepID=A0A9P4IIB3_9PEZI|nr:SET domain-containing protein [Rhizodiscina lignyota]